LVENLIHRNIAMYLQASIMGLTRTELFTAEQNEIASLAKALAHPARVAILQHLLRENTCINGDLVQETGLSQATISQHLRELKAAGLIQGTIEGVSVCYCIDASKWTEVQNLFAEMFNTYQNPSTCC
jgi:predicted transcriptional regulator